jgi:hypothetical protein
MGSLTVTQERVPTLTAAGLLTFAYVAVMIAVGLSCANFILRIDNQIAIAVSVLAATAMLKTGLDRRVSESAKVLVELPAGIVAGLYYQPSSAIVLSAAVVVLGLASLRTMGSLKSRVVGVLLLVGGAAMGHWLMLGLMGAISPADLRC